MYPESEIIKSRNNPKIIQAAKLRLKKHRDESRFFCFEGKKLMSEAASFGVKIKALFYTKANSEYVTSLPGDFERYEVTDEVYEKLTDEKSPEGLFCVAEYLDRIKFLSKIDKDEKISAPFIAVSVRDPGNLGTLIRSAAALGVGTLILSGDCADVYNKKTVRASMGALFKSDIMIVEDINSLPDILCSLGYPVYAATLHRNSVDLLSLKEKENICFAVGNEGHGLPESFIERCSGCVTIPMSPGSESLNVTLAASILMWESFKKRL